MRLSLCTTCFVLLGSACLPDADLQDERGPDSLHQPVAPNSSAGVQVTGPPQPPTQPTAMPAAKVDDDGMPPTLAQFQVEAQGCVRARVTLSKPATVHFVFAAGGAQERLEVLLRPDRVASVRTPLVALPGQVEAQVWVEAVDGQGRRAETAPQPFVTPAARAPLVITEVMANPAGSEYTQEYVELLNAGQAPLDLSGFTLEDGSAIDPLPSEVLGPGARALVVAESFDAAAGSDPLPSPEVLLLRVPGRLGRDGLSNSGEPVTVRDPNGGVVTRYEGHVNTSATAWNGRSIHRVPQEDPCDDPELWTDRPQPPTPGW